MTYITNFTWVEKDLLKKCKGNYIMVARPRKYNFALTSENNNMVRMFFEPISNEPEPIMNNGNADFVKAYYIALDEHQDEEFLPDFYDPESYDVETRAEECADFYANKLAVFTPVYRINSDGQSFKNMQIIDVVPDNGGAYYIAVPKVEMDNRRFEEILKNGEYFEISNFDNKLVDGTDLVICGEYAYRFMDKKPFESFLIGSDLRNDRWKYSGNGEIAKVKISGIEGYEECIIDATRTVSLLEDSFIQEIMNTGKALSINETEKHIEHELKQEIDISEGANASISKAEEESEEIISDDEELKASNASEMAFINGLRELTRSNNLVYDYKDLVNFHTSVKTNPLTILSGMSGTGKTQLAYNYARMLDLSEDNNTLLFMPISPSYSEPSDVLGYLNPMTNEYVPAETGLVDFLVHANNNKNKMHMVIFDEMNLSQVEYWFSPFISILEKDMGERYLKLYDVPEYDYKRDNETDNKKKYPSKIMIDDNVIFVGTVNVDETTKDFSDRLLDRTFVINLRKIKFQDVFEGLKMTQNDTGKADISAAKCSDASIFMTWNKKYNLDHLDAFKENQKELEFLDEFSALLDSTIHSGGISHRVLRNIGYYLLNIPETENGRVIDRAEAFDIIINQTVMQKIRGTEAQLSSLIGDGGEDLNPTDSSSLVELLNKYSDVSKFDNVRKSINKKAEDLRINGYTN